MDGALKHGIIAIPAGAHEGGAGDQSHHDPETHGAERLGTAADRPSHLPTRPVRAVLGWNLYPSNPLAIGSVTLWNFGLNARFNWGRLPRTARSGAFVWAACALSCALFSSVVSGQDFRVEGDLQVVRKSHPADVGQSVFWSFAVDAAPSSYRIRLFQTDRPEDFHEYTCTNGTMLVVHHLTHTVMLNAHTRQTNRATQYPAIIDNRDVPPNDGTQAQFVWLAFASQGFFRDITNNVIRQLRSPEDPATRTQPFDEEFAAHMLPGVPALPAGIDFMSDGYYRSYNPATKRLDVIRLRPPYDRGYTNAVYRVLQTTNVGPNELPAQFRFILYSSPVSAVPPFERLVLDGRVTSAAALDPERPINPSGVSGVLSVADYRIRGSAAAGSRTSSYEFFAYPLTNGGWISDQKLEEMRRRAEARAFRRLQTQAAANRGKHASRVVITVVTASVLLLPLVMLMAFRLNNHIKNKNIGRKT